MELRRTLLRGGRRVLGLGTTAYCYVSPLRMARHGVHERPFFEVPADSSKGESYEVARDALLQLNIMARRGIEPDVLMYTSLINIMGKAGLEWQAYKLFSRMIEGNIRPLPETYVALRDATAKHRTRLRDEIQTKIEEIVSTFPEELAVDERNRQRDEDRQCVAKFEDYMRGELPPPLSTPSASASPPLSTAADDGSAARLDTCARAVEADGKAKEHSGEAAPVTTMNIRNPADAWATAKHAEDIRGRPQQFASGDAATDLRAALGKLHEEELRIYLSAHRQLRHGNKSQLVERVLKTVGEHAIRAMLERRNHYFRSVEEILAHDLEVLRSDPPPPPLPSGSPGNRHAREVDRTITAAEAEGTAPEVLLTPWGMIRKPIKYREDRSMAAHWSHAATPTTGADSEAQLARLETVRLTAPELMLIRQKAEADDLDELPESLLRRYAAQFRLRWRRRQPLSLVNAVSWHATTFLSPNVREDAGGTVEGLVTTAPPPTPAIRLQKEREGMQETLDNFEAFRVIAQQTNNLQVVDDKEINLHLKRVRRDALRQERKAEEGLRRESNIMAAAGLAASARTYTAPPNDDADAEGKGSHVLGWGEATARYGGEAKAEEGNRLLTRRNDSFDEDEEEDEQQQVAAAEAGGPPHLSVSAQPTDELPPWELTGREEEFNLTTGRFGDLDAGRYQELSDSSIRVLPSRDAQKQWTVDRHLLPRGLKDVVERAELDHLQYRDAIESEYGRRRQYAKYRKWDNMIQKAHSKKANAVTGDGEDRDGRSMRPLLAKKRLAQLLRRGAEQQRVSEAVKEKFNRSL